MASGKCDYLRNIMLNLVLNNAAWTPPTVVHVVLSTQPFVPSADGLNCSEVPLQDGTGNPTGYDRVSLTCDTTNFPSAQQGVTANGIVVSFPTAISAWGDIYSFYIVDSAAGGNCLYGADLTAGQDGRPPTVNTGDTPTFGIGAIGFVEL